MSNWVCMQKFTLVGDLVKLWLSNIKTDRQTDRTIYSGREYWKLQTRSHTFTNWFFHSGKSPTCAETTCQYWIWSKCIKSMKIKSIRVIWEKTHQVWCLVLWNSHLPFMLMFAVNTNNLKLFNKRYLLYWELFFTNLKIPQAHFEHYHQCSSPHQQHWGRI